jgi:levanase
MFRPLALLIALALTVLIAPWTSAVAAPPDPRVVATYDETYRPQFHFSAAKNWLNDPNGLVYYKGLYHLFFQHNPNGNTWGNMSWGHATSRDLVHWKEQPLAIPQTFNAAGDSIEDIFSGSAVVDTNNTSGFGTKKNPPMVAVYTSAYTGKHPTLAGRQAQSLAYSTDEGQTWTKYAGNPVLDIGSGEFRDPKVFWYAPAKQWRMVVVRALEHKVDIYGSPNLKTWTHLSEFGPAGATGGAWECPDLFPLAVDGNPRNIKWVMVVNLNPGGIAGGSGGQYFVGDFDGTTFTSDDPPSYTPPTGTVLEDFENPTYGSWTTSGDAFGDAPTAGNAPGQGGVAGYLGDQLANSFHGGDGARGTLTSPEFPINADYLNFLVGGGNHPRVDGTTLDPSLPDGTVFNDFEGATWGTGWTATGDFTNDGPRPGTIGDQQPVIGYQGQKLVNTFTDHDSSTGTISSPTFTIGQNYINLLVGGGNHPYTGTGTDATAVNLIVDGQVVRTATGQDSELANWVAWNVADLQGKQARIDIVDNNTGGWGHILTDQIMFSPEAATPVSVETTVNLFVDGLVVRTATGPNSETLDWTGWDVRDLAGKTARIQIVDNNNGGWGHILTDQFTFADQPALSTTQRAHWLDYGRDFYAGVTFNNTPNNKRIMIAWMNNWQYGGNIPTDPWRSAMSLPRELTLTKTKGKTELRSTPVPQLKALRKPAPVHISAARLLQGTTTLRARGASGDTLEIKSRFRARDAEKFGLNVRVGNGEKTVIGYDVFRKGVYLDRTRSGRVDFSTTFPSTEFAPVKPDANGDIRLHIYVDRSSVEVFANDGRVAITDQVFPQPDSDNIQLFSTGGRAQLKELTIWQLKSAWR